MGSGELGRLAPGAPFLHWLLTTGEITTPALETRCGCRLRSVREVTIVGGRLVRRHVLMDGLGRAVEVAEVRMGSAPAAWAALSEPLGPWLVAKGWRLRKVDIRPLAFRNGVGWNRVFPGARWCLEVFGRSYGLEAKRGGDVEHLQVVEAWNPPFVGRFWG